MFHREREQAINELSSIAETSQITGKRVTALPINLFDTEQTNYGPTTHWHNPAQAGEIQKEKKGTSKQASTFPSKYFDNFFCPRELKFKIGALPEEEKEELSDLSEQFSANKRITLESDIEYDLPDNLFDDSLLDEELVRFF